MPNTTTAISTSGITDFTGESDKWSTVFEFRVMLLPKSSQFVIEERQSRLFHPHKISPSLNRWKSIRKLGNSNSYRVLCFGEGTPGSSFVQTGSSRIEAFIYLIFIMKYLEYTPLDRISDFLSHLNLGERTIKGSLEAYSCKHTGTDKKLSFSLENEILDYLGKSADNDSSSPVEYLSCRSSRKMLVYLILTLYHMYPDYDFSAVETHQFFTEETWDNFKQIFDVYMFDASKDWAEENEGSSLLDTLYKALDEVVKLAECEIYSYNPDSDADPLLERGAIWAFNFFFYNRKLKRVVSFRFSCISNLVSEGFPMDGICYEEDGEIFDDMDM